MGLGKGTAAVVTDDKVEVTFRKQKRADGWFLIEQWPGKPDVEYGPMPAEHVEPMMDHVLALHDAVAKDIAEQNKAAISQPEAGRGFDPQQESTWLKQQKNQKGS